MKRLLVAALALGLVGCDGPVQVSGSAPIAGGGPPIAAAFADPTGYKDKSWTAPDESGEQATFVVKVPSDWAETNRASFASDYLDPSGQVRLSVDVTAALTGAGLDQTPAQAADTELRRLAGSAGFELVGRRTLPDGRNTGYGSTEIVYRLGAGQCTYRFIGLDDVTETRLGTCYPADVRAGAEKVLDTVTSTAEFAG